MFISPFTNPMTDDLRRDIVSLPKFTTHTVLSLNKFFGQSDDGLRTGPKHVVVYYISLLILILLCSWLYVYIDIYTHYSFVLLREKYLIRTEIRHSDRPARSLVTIATTLKYQISLISVVSFIKHAGKSKVHPTTGHEDPEAEYRYSSTLSLTSALDGVGGQRYAPAALPPGQTRYPLYRRLGGPQGRSGRVRKISPPPGYDPRTVQPVTGRYTDCAIPVLLLNTPSNTIL